MIILVGAPVTGDELYVDNTTTSSTLLVHASYVDWDGNVTFTPGRLNSPITTNGNNVVVAYPANGSYRTVKMLSIYNNYTAAVALTVKHVPSSGSTITLLSITLPVGYTLIYSEGVGWQTLDEAGDNKVTAQSGRLITTNRLVSTTATTSISGSYQVSPYTNKIRVKVISGGGGGGSTTSVASAAGAGGGGGSGGYAEYIATVTPSAVATYVVGGGGSASAVGSASSFTIGGTTVTAQTSGGGAAGTATTTVTTKAGGAGSGVSTNGTLNGAGAPGGYGTCPLVGSGTTEIVGSGKGGSTYFGGGGKAVAAAGVGIAGAGYGAGGSGAACGTAAINAGGSGANGIIIVEEYT